MPLRVVVLVEGHSEADALRTLFERIWYDYLLGDYIEVETWRAKQAYLLTKDNLKDLVGKAALKLHETEQTATRKLLLIMVDTEGKAECCPKTKALDMLAWAREARSDVETEIAVVLPNPMFETWFAASAESLRGYKGFPDDLPKSDDPEGNGLGKGWGKKHLGRKYSETDDAPSFVSQMDIQECETASRSFRKLVKELRERLPLPNLENETPNEPTS